MIKQKIAITGGIGSGKSYLCHIIENEGFPIFYCDDEAKKILHNDKVVQKQLKDLVGNQLYDEKGNLNKPIMRDFICRGKKFAAQIDAIVHPRVGEAFITWCEQQKSNKVFMECALLYEAGFDKYVDQTIHVSAPEEIRVNRVMKRDRVSREKALEWIALQMPETEKSRKADFVIINDGESDLKAQIRQIITD